MRALLSSDLHLTDRKRDEYRWTVFPFLSSFAERQGMDAIFLLGDITDAKDHHSSKLVNRITDSLCRMPVPVYWSVGNHDYADPAHPFFGFLGHLAEQGVHYIAKPTTTHVAGDRVLFLPHTRQPRAVWSKLTRKFKRADLVCCHQTFNKSVASNGMKLDGLPTGLIAKYGYEGPIISGDIHVPQTLGSVTYCGSPHPVRFGDAFAPRVLAYEDGDLRSIPRTTIRRAVIDIFETGDLDSFELDAGDQAKVRIHLRRADFPDWPNIRARVLAELKARKVDVMGVELRERASDRKRKKDEQPARDTTSPSRLFNAFCRHRRIGSDLRVAGRKLLR